MTLSQPDPPSTSNKPLFRLRLAVDDSAVESPGRAIGDNKGAVCNAVEVSVLAFRGRDQDVLVFYFDGGGCEGGGLG